MRLNYDIIWEGGKIGDHVVEVSHNEDGHIVVKHKRKVEVEVLFVSAFSETHEATEIWDKDQHYIIQIDGHTVLNGDKHEVEGRRL